MSTVSKSPSYLLQRQSIYYFRVGIPLALRDALGRNELRLSLETGYLKAARAKAQLLAAVASVFFTQAQGDQGMAQMSQRQLNALFFEWLKVALEKWSREHAVGKAKTEALIAEQQAAITSELFDLRDSLRMGKYLEYGDEVIAIAESQGRVIRDDFDEVKHCSQAYVHARRAYLKILLHRLEGDYDFEIAELMRFQQRQLLSLGDEELPANGLTSGPVEKHKLSTVIAKFVEEKARSEAWGGRSLKELPGALHLLVEVLGDPHVEDLDSASMRGFKETLAKLPANRDKLKATRGMTVQQALDVPGLKPLSVTRQNFILSIVSSFFEFAEGNGYIKRNPAKGMQIKTRTRQDEEREIFTEDDLRAIFTSPVYAQGKSKHAWQFWLPLLGYFTGARIEELCQLGVEDIKVVEGVPVIDYNEQGDKRLKSASSRRVIPIHPHLIKPLGFFGYVEAMKKAGGAKLFPGLRKTQDRFSHAPSQWFSRLRNKLGIEGKKSFHSFRHTFANNLKQAEASEQAVKELMGHAKDDMTRDRYGKPLSPKVLLKTLIKLPLPPVPGG